MAYSFAEMKAARDADKEKLLKQLDNMDKRRREDDGTWWVPTVDKAGNGVAVFRWLPAPLGETDTHVKWMDHGFKGPGGWYIENNLQSIGLDDPVSEMNSMLWAQGEGSEGRKRVSGGGPKGSLNEFGTKRRQHLASNIYIISDPAKRENEGRVFRFKYGPRIFSKINDLMHPVLPDDPIINPFDLWDGCNFKLVIRREDGQRNYNSSEWIKPPQPLFKDDAKMEAVWSQCHSLAALIDPKNYKSYDELKKKLERVMGGKPAPGYERDDNDPPAREPAPRRSSPAPAAPATGARSSVSEEVEPWEERSTEDEDPASYFAKLVDKDV